MIRIRTNRISAAQDSSTVHGSSAVSSLDSDQKKRNQRTKMNTALKNVRRSAFVFLIIVLCSTAGLASHTMRGKVLKDSNVEVESSDVQKVSTRMMFRVLHGTEETVV